MKIKRGFVLQNVSGSFVACATGKLTREFSGVIRMNDSGVFIWKLLTKGTTEEKIVAEVMEAFGIDEELAGRDVRAFLENLQINGVLE